MKKMQTKMGTGGMAQVIEYLPRKLKALNSNPVPPKKNKIKQNKTKQNDECYRCWSAGGEMGRGEDWA
jgi:hypothetical protein